MKLYKKEGRTIETARKHCPNKSLRPEIKYSEVAFTYVHNGKNKPHVKTGDRPNQKVNKTSTATIVRWFGIFGHFR